MDYELFDFSNFVDVRMFHLDFGCRDNNTFKVVGGQKQLFPYKGFN